MKHLALMAALAAPTFAFATPDPSDWDAVTTEANGQTVYWNAWGGSTTTNDFIAWVGERVAEDYGVVLEHVKLTDTADAVTRVLSERQAGENDDGAIDMIWINGSNFAAMKEADLLFGPFAEQLPNWAFVDSEGKTVQTDFTSPVGHGAGCVCAKHRNDAGCFGIYGRAAGMGPSEPRSFQLSAAAGFLGDNVLEASPC